MHEARLSKSLKQGEKLRSGHKIALSQKHLRLKTAWNKMLESFECAAQSYLTLKYKKVFLIQRNQILWKV